MWMLWIDSIRADVTYAFRNLRRQPGFTVTVVLVLGVAIGLNATLFTLIAGVVLRPWGGVAAPSQVVRLYLVDPTGPAAGFSVADARALARAAKSFTGIGAMKSESVRVSSTAGAETAQTLMVSGNLFDVLGITPALGRRFTLDEDRPGDPKSVAILGHQFWETHFGANAAVVGSLLRVNDVPFTIVGVASREFTNSEAGYDTELFLPLSALPLLKPGDPSVVRVLNDPTSCCADLVARLRPGFDRVQARAELNVLTRGFASFSGTPARGVVITGTAFVSQPGRADSAQALVTVTLLAGALLLVWLIACANIGNLLLARAVARFREISTRLALGASRGRLVRQLLCEGLVLALIASGIGVGVAYQLPFLIFRLVADSRTTALFPFSVTPDVWVLTYTVMLAALSVAAFALAPALLVTRVALRGALQRREGLWAERLTLRGMLLAVQVAVSVVLLVSAGLLVRGVQRQAGAFEPGFEIDDVTAVSLDLPEGVYDRPRATALFTGIAAAARDLPAVEFAFASHEPFSQYRHGTLFHLPGEAREQARQLLYLDVSPEYLDVLRIPIVAGRSFEAADAGRPYVIVNETMARRSWPGADPIGKTFFMRPRGPVDEMVPREVIGVVRDVRTNVFEDAVPMFYRPFVPGTDVFDFISSDPRASQAPVLLLKGPNVTADAIAPAVARLDTRIRIRLVPLSASLRTMLDSARWGPILAATLGAFALGLATVGLFGVFAYAVQQRTREIGIRMALGAQPSAVVRLVLTGHSRAVAIGLCAGLLGAVAVSAALRSRLHGLSPFDPLAYLAVGSILACCGLAAGYLPARRATRISPINALRTD